VVYKCLAVLWLYQCGRSVVSREDYQCDEHKEANPELKKRGYVQCYILSHTYQASNRAVLSTHIVRGLCCQPTVSGFQHGRGCAVHPGRSTSRLVQSTVQLAC
jgi:hypothetical protein